MKRQTDIQRYSRYWFTPHMPMIASTECQKPVTPSGSLLLATDPQAFELPSTPRIHTSSLDLK